MSEATKDTQDTNDLDARAAALKADVGTPPVVAPSAPASEPAAPLDFEALAAEAVNLLVNATAESAPDAQPAAVPPQTVDEALAAAAADLANTPAASADLTATTTEAAAPSAEAPSQDLAKAVERLIQDAPPQPAEPAAAETPKKIEALDAQIANLADDLIAGEFADEQNVLQGQVGEPPPKETPPPPLGSEPPAAKPAPKPVVEAAAPKAVEASAPVTPAPAAAPAPAPKTPPAPNVARKAASSAAKVAARQGSKFAERLKPLGLKFLELASLPLKDKPKFTRDLVGWLAIWTFFMAASLWGYVLFFRSAKPPAPSVKEVAAAEHGEAKPQAKGGHGEAKSGHGESKSGGHGEKKDAKADKAKKPPAKKEPAKKDAGKSHGGGH